MTRFPWWYRSGPWVGLVGGLLVGLWTHLGLGSRSTWWIEATGVAALFDVAWPLGYAVLALVGFATGWLLRAAERRAGVRP